MTDYILVDGAGRPVITGSIYSLDEAARAAQRLGLRRGTVERYDNPVVVAVIEGGVLRVVGP